MLTINDRRAREVLIATHDAFADPTNWNKGAYVGRSGFFEKRYSHCLMGRIGHELGMLISASHVHYKGHPQERLYRSIATWMSRRAGESPERVNDRLGWKGVQIFLEERIAELEAELVKDAQVKDAAIEHPEAPQRSLLTAALALIF